MLFLLTATLLLPTEAFGAPESNAPFVIEPLKNAKPILEARKGRERMYNYQRPYFGYKDRRPYQGYTFYYDYPSSRPYYAPYTYHYRYNYGNQPYTYYYDRRYHHRNYDPITGLFIELFD